VVSSKTTGSLFGEIMDYILLFWLRGELLSAAMEEAILAAG
jgi:hypothetical protein